MSASYKTIRISGIGLLLAILVAVALVPSHIVKQISVHETEVSQNVLQLSATIKLYHRFQSAFQQYEIFMEYPESNYNHIVTDLDQAIEWSEQLETLFSRNAKPMEITHIKKMTRSLKLIKSAVIKYAREVIHNPASDSGQELRLAVQRIQAETTDLLATLMNNTLKRTQGAHKKMSQEIRQGRDKARIGMLFGIVAGVIIAVSLSLSLKKPIARLIAGTQALTDGDLDYRIKTQQHDEIGQLAQAFNKMADHIRYLVKKEQVLARRAVHSEKSEKKKSEELKRAKEWAEEASRAKSQFVANMSHELRTPMNAVIGFTDLILKTELSEQHREYLNLIKTSGKSLLDIINDILDFSKIEAGQLALERQPFRLPDIMEEITDLFAGNASKKNIELVAIVHRDTPHMLIGDPMRLRQVLINLVSNAIKFTSKGEVVIRVRPSAISRRKTTLSFSVVDTGIGIKKDHIHNLFDSFVQADESTTRQYGGTGLGLSICKGIVKMMGGDIWVESMPGKGSEFHFNPQFGIQDNTDVRPHADHPGLHVLVVDKNTPLREYLKQMLTGCGFDVCFAESGTQAISLVTESSEKRPYDLIIVDWNLPDMDGFDMVSRIENHPQPISTPIILLSPLGKTAPKSASDSITPRTVINKPIKQTLFLEEIMRVTGCGITFTDTKENKSHQLTEGSADLGRMNILLAEDNHINQRLTTSLLENEGFNVTIAENGKQAVKAVFNTSFHLVLMDMQMPEMDGYEATRTIRGNPKYQELPIIAITADAMKGTRERCLDAGMNDYLSKPIDTNELFKIIRKWIPASHNAPEKISAGRAVNSNRKIQDAQAEPPNIPGVNVAKGIARVNGRRELFEQLLIEFTETYGNAGKELETAIRGGEIRAALDTTHSIKGIAGNLSATTLYRAASDLHVALGVGNQDAYDPLLTKFQKALHQLLEAVQTLKATESPADPDLAEKSAPHGMVSRDQIQEIVDKLIKLIQSGDLAAQDFLSQSKTILANNNFSDDLDTLEKYINSYDFEPALLLLKKMKVKTNLH